MYEIKEVAAYIIYYLNFKEKKVTHTSIHVLLLLLNNCYFIKFKKKLFDEEFILGKYSIIYPSIYKEFFVLAHDLIIEDYVTYNYSLSYNDTLYLNHLLDYYGNLLFLDLLEEGEKCIIYSKKMKNVL